MPEITPPKGWNPRYVLWAKSNGNTPEVQATKDGYWFEGEFTPMMLDFMTWIAQKWREWATELGFAKVDNARLAVPNCHEHFDAWLTKKVEEKK